MDYPTEWQTLWPLGLVKPNKNDDMVRTKPEKYSTLQTIAPVASSAPKETVQGYYSKHTHEIFHPLGENYVVGPAKIL